MLEIGVGTGRLALPLAAAGLHVRGVDGSAVMLEHLADKPGGRDIPTALGDFSEVAVPGTFALAALTFNTIFALPDQDAQVGCFANVARHLRPGGRFVVEASTRSSPITTLPARSWPPHRSCWEENSAFGSTRSSIATPIPPSST